MLIRSLKGLFKILLKPQTNPIFLCTECHVDCQSSSTIAHWCESLHYFLRTHAWGCLLRLCWIFRAILRLASMGMIRLHQHFSQFFLKWLIATYAHMLLAHFFDFVNCRQIWSLLLCFHEVFPAPWCKLDFLECKVE